MNKMKILKQAYYLDKRIDTKIEQIEELQSLAEKVTAVASDVCVQSSHDGQRIPNAVINIVELKTEVMNDLCELLKTKRVVREIIGAVDDIECKLILEKRYVCYLDWNTIADEMGFSSQRIFQIHKKAISIVERLE